MLLTMPSSVTVIWISLLVSSPGHQNCPIGEVSESDAKDRPSEYVLFLTQYLYLILWQYMARIVGQ